MRGAAACCFLCVCRSSCVSKKRREREKRKGKGKRRKKMGKILKSKNFHREK
jgi:hypothetical protein